MPAVTIPGVNTPTYQSWAASVANRFTQHETHTTITKALAGGTATTANPGVGPTTLTTTGLWLFGFAVDLQPGAGGWGFASFYPSLLANANKIGTDLVSGLRYEATGRAQINGLYAIPVTTAPYDVYVRCQTYAASCPFNAIAVSAWRLYDLT